MFYTTLLEYVGFMNYILTIYVLNRSVFRLVESAGLTQKDIREKTPLEIRV